MVGGVLRESLAWLRGRRPSAAGAAAALALAALTVAAWLHARIFLKGVGIDDAFITFRYAENLAHGRGFVFNPGEHVEGTSTFLTTVLLSIGVRLGIAPMLASRFLGLASHAALITTTYAAVRAVAPRPSRLVALAAASMVAASTPLAYYAVSGMETVFFTAALTVAVTLYVVERRPAGSPRAWAFAFGVAALIRPEGAGYFAIVWALDTARSLLQPGGRARGLRRAARAAGDFAMVLGPLLLFRLLYFHALVPNTMLAKASLLSEIRAAPTFEAAWDKLASSEGVGSVQAFFDGPGPVVWAFAAGLLLLRGARFRLTLLAAVCAFACLVDVLDRGDWMPFQRLVLPTFPIVAIGVGAGLRSVLFQPGQRLGRTALASAAATLAIAYLTAAHMWPESSPPQPAEPYRVSMGRALASVRRDTDVLATDMAGVIPYYSGIRTIDMLGLCDRYLATHGRPLGTMGKTDAAYVIGKHPTFYQMNFPSGIRDLFFDPAFAADRDAYFVVDTPFVRTAKWRDKKILLVRKDRPDVQAVARAMGGELVDLRSMIAGGRI